VRIKP